MAIDEKIFLFNSNSNKKEVLIPIKKRTVSIYSCGPTVYERIHLGNFRRYFLDDVLVRTINFYGLKTKLVRNITDVGHLTSDSDSGEDKVEERAKKEGVEASKIIKKFTELFEKDCKLLNIKKADITPFASKHINEQIEFIEKLEKDGFTYKISDGVYFDTSKTLDYGKLVELDKEGLMEGVRVEKNPEKKNITDFALWKFSPKEEKRQMEWESPWSIGFPGWHIECSAMSKKYLGFPFDIHIGGIDNAPTHNTNEIAQNEALIKKKSVNVWMHSEHMLVDGKKMSKSLQNTYTTDDLKRFHIHPLSFKYFSLNTHYRKRLDFTWDALRNAQEGYFNLIEEIARLKDTKGILKNIFKKNSMNKDTVKRAKESLFNDLNTSSLLAIIQKIVSEKEILDKEKISTIEKIDNVLGLSLIEKAEALREIPNNIRDMAKKRDAYRKNEDFGKADGERKNIMEKGFILEDTKEGYRIIRKMTYLI